MKTNILQGKLPPLNSIICNSHSWSITTGVKFTTDGYESLLAVNHFAPLSLVLRLLDKFGPEEGEIAFWGDGCHQPREYAHEKFLFTLPDDLNFIVKPKIDAQGEEAGQALQRYEQSKLAMIMGVSELNKRLTKVLPSLPINMTSNPSLGPKTEQDTCYVERSTR